MRNTDQDWTKIAEEQPYWGILSTDQFKGSHLAPEVLDSFFASGEAEIAALFRDIHVMAPGFSPGRSLDFGCGVGRLLIPIAKRSNEAMGVDIAPKMLSLAENYLRLAGLAKASVVLSDDDLSRVTGQFDFVHSYIVLQHIPPIRGNQHFRRMLGMLTPGGMFAIHFNFAKRRDLMVHEIPAAKYYRREGSHIHDLSPSAAHATGTIHMFDYDLNELFAIASEFTDIPLSVRVMSDEHLSAYLIGTRTKG